MPSPLQFLPLIAKQSLGKQQLQRVPEPDAVTDDTDNVAQYDRVMETKLAISYAIAIETIYRIRPEPFGGRALDICCGPGHLSVNMAKELQLDSLVGIDLSAPMVAVATANAESQGLSNARFATGDATNLAEHSSDAYDLTTMMDAAHHMPSLDLVTQALIEMDRVTKPEGLVVVMDLVRLRTRALTESYVHLLADDYVRRGLPNFLDDFRNSMYAAWTPEELASAVPASSERKWHLLVPRGLPFAQFLIGCPEDAKHVFQRRSGLWDTQSVPVPKSDRSELRIARLTLRSAGLRAIQP